MNTILKDLRNQANLINIIKHRPSQRAKTLSRCSKGKGEIINKYKNNNRYVHIFNNMNSS